MAAPSIIAAASTRNTTNQTTLTVNIPDGSNVAGRRIVLALNLDNQQAPTFPANWNQVGTFGEGASSNGRMYVFYKDTLGSEGYASTGATISVTVGTTDGFASVAFLISGFDTGTAPEATFVSPASTGNPDPPTLSPTGGSKDYLFLAFAGFDGSALNTPTITGYPANYGLNQTTQAPGFANGCGAAGAGRQLTAASDDPGAFTLSGAEQRSAATVAVHPIPNRRARVYFAEMEVPTAPRRGRIYFAEMEVPDAPTTDRRGQVYFAEMEVPTAPRRARIYFAEVEVPNAARRARIYFAEMEAPAAPRRAVVYFAELEVPDVGAEPEPEPPRRGGARRKRRRRQDRVHLENLRRRMELEAGLEEITAEVAEEVAVEEAQRAEEERQADHEVAEFFQPAQPKAPRPRRPPPINELRFAVVLRPALPEPIDLRILRMIEEDDEERFIRDLLERL